MLFSYPLRAKDESRRRKSQILIQQNDGVAAELFELFNALLANTEGDVKIQIERVSHVDSSLFEVFDFIVKLLQIRIVAWIVSYRNGTTQIGTNHIVSEIEIAVKFEETNEVILVISCFFHPEVRKFLLRVERNIPTYMSLE